MPKEQKEDEQLEPRIYYTRSANLVLWPQKPKRLVQDGQQIVESGNAIHFTATPENWGKFMTKDANEIAYLERRKIDPGDVFDADEFIKRTASLEDRLSRTERTLHVKNELIEKLERQIAKSQKG